MTQITSKKNHPKEIYFRKTSMTLTGPENSVANIAVRFQFILSDIATFGVNQCFYSK